MKYAMMVVLVLMLCSARIAGAVEQSLFDPQQEQRAQNIMQDVRCIVCAGQSVADSDATLARDMRRMIREQIAAGQNDRQIHDLIRQHYGDGIFLRPDFNHRTWILWVSPILLLGVGGAVVAAQFRFRRRRRGPKS